MINEAIRAPKVRLIDDDGSQLGIKQTAEALEYAFSKNLDLVLVAAQADPPVARVMDNSKFLYEQQQKAKLARKHQSQIHVKEIKLRPKIGIHDYETKKGHVVRFLNQRAKVKVTIMFRGRETTHPERGRDLLMRLAEDVKEIGMVESAPILDGRNMVMLLGPTKQAGQPPAPASGGRENDGDGQGPSGGREPRKPTPSDQEASVEVTPEVSEESVESVGSSRDAKTEDKQSGEKALQGDGDGEGPAPERDEEPQPGEEVREEPEAGVQVRTPPSPRATYRTSSDCWEWVRHAARQALRPRSQEEA